jgi:2-phosphoglycerate kinase
MTKVILIGGSPMCGKSTVSKVLASRLGWAYISTDDIGEIIQTVIDINHIKGQDYSDYYANTDKDKLIADIQEYHSKMKPAILRLIDIHSTWGTPIIIEGWALYPKIMNEIENQSVKSVWLIANKSLFENRFLNNIEFYQLAVNPKTMKENYLYRSLWHNDYILEQCKLKKQSYILVSENMSVDDILKKIQRII